MPVGRGRRPRLQILRRAGEDHSLKDKRGKLLVLRHRRFLPRTFRKQWWWQSSLRHEFHEFTPIDETRWRHEFESLAVASRPLQHEFTRIDSEASNSWLTVSEISGHSCNSCHAITLVPFVSLGPQNSNQVAQLIFDIAWQHHRVSDFFAQQLPIALTQSMERLLHGVLGHAQFTCNLCLRRAI